MPPPPGTGPLPAGPPRPPEVLCVGETMALVTPVRAEPLQVAQLFELAVGGAESNVAMHLCGLGHPAGWAGRVGADPLGARLCATLHAAGVDTSLVEVDSTAPTGVYFKDPGSAGTTVHYYRSGSAASLMDEGFVGGAALAGVRVLHLTGITQALSDSCLRMVEALLDAPREVGSIVSFDVNHRPALWPASAAAEPLRVTADRADLVFVGLDEAHALWGVSAPDEVPAVLPGPATIVVKDGAIGATALHPGGQDFVPAPAVDVVEPVGAGDAFAAGYLAALLDGRSIPERLRLGHLTAAAALGVTGDHAPPPDRDVIAERLAAPDDRWHPPPAAGRPGGRGDGALRRSSGHAG